MEYVKLEEICTIVSGGTPSRSKPNYWNNGNIPWIKIKDMKSKYIDSAEEFITEEGLNNSSTKMLKRNTILYSIFATLGEVGILKIDACTNQAIAGLSLKEDSNILKEYLYYYLKSKKKDVNNLGRGVAQNNINLSLLRKFKIPVIPLRQQKKIIEVLDNVSSTINNYERELALLDELVKARFVEMFGNPVSNSKDLPVQKMNNVSPICQYDGSFEESVWLLNLDMVESQTGRIINYNIVSKDEIGGSVCTFDENNVLYSKLRPYLNKVVIPDGKGYATSELVPLRPDPKIINRIYLAYLLRSNEFVEMIKEKVAGAKMPRVSMSDFREFNVPIPPLELQNQFALFVQEIDKSRSRIQKSLEASQELFDSLMQEYFG